MKKLICFVLGFAAGYYYGKNKDTIDNDEKIQKEIEYLKKKKDSILSKIKSFGKKVGKQYFSMEGNDNEKETKNKSTKKKNKK